jgi:HD-GYP domain-containing protein (c-di-GMP phosphodiesterase class II)
MRSSALGRGRWTADLEWVLHSVKKGLQKKKREEEIEVYHRNLEWLVEEKTSGLQRAYSILKGAHQDSARVWVEAIDAKEPYTLGHSDRVRKISLRP